MASKYEMVDLREKLVHLVEAEWPLTLNELEDYDNCREKLGERFLDDYPASEWSIHLLPEPAAAIALGEEFNIRSILPAAYYDTLRCAPYCGFYAWDDAVENCNFSLIGRDKPVRWHYLTRRAFQKMWSFQAAIIDISRHLLRSGPSLSYRPTVPPKLICASLENCDPIWRKIHEHVHEPLLEDRDFLCGLRKLEKYHEPRLEDASCALCRVRIAWRDCRRKWRQLGKEFGRRWSAPWSSTRSPVHNSRLQ